MKIAFHLRITYCLLAASVGLNFWLWHQESPTSGSDSSHRVVNQLDTQSAKPEKSQSNQAGGASKATVTGEIHPKANPVAEKFSQDEFLYGVAPNQPELPKDTISLNHLREMVVRKPSAEKWNVHARLLLPDGKSVDLGALDLSKDQRSRLEHIKEFPYADSFDLADVSAGRAVTPTTPASFAFQNTGVSVDIEVTMNGGSVILGGRFLHRTFVGFGRMPGDSFLPISDGKGTLLSENKMLSPRFSVGESPFFAAPTLGKPCLVPVQTAAGSAQLELVCTATEA